MSDDRYLWRRLSPAEAEMPVWAPVLDCHSPTGARVVVAAVLTDDPHVLSVRETIILAEDDHIDFTHDVERRDHPDHPETLEDVERSLGRWLRNNYVDRRRLERVGPAQPRP